MRVRIVGAEATRHAGQSGVISSGVIVLVTDLSKSGQLGIGLLVGLMDVATANNTVAIVMANPIASEMAKDFDISHRKALKQLFLR